MKSINRKIGTGVLWNLASLLVARGGSLLFTMVLARFLAPDAFGLIAIVLVVFEIAKAIADSGLGAALIRLPTVSDTELNTVFWTNLAISVGLYAVIFLTAPLIAAFYEQSQLVPLVQVMGLVVLINAANLVQIAILSRKMDFKTQMQAQTWGVLVSGILAVAAAAAGAGVWSLVLQLLIANFVRTGFIWFRSDWRPALEFSWNSFQQLFGFGAYLMLESIFTKLYQNSYVLVIGKFFTPEITGFYFLARRLSQILSVQLTRAVQTSTYPALATMQDNLVALKQKYRQILQLTFLLISPVMAFFAGVAPLLVPWLLGEKWVPAIPYVQILSVAAIFYPLHSLNLNVLKVVGRSDLVLRVGFIKKAIGLTLLVVSLPYGVIGIVIGQLVATLIALLPNTYYSIRLVGYQLREQLADIGKPLVLSAAAGLIGYLVIAYYNLHPIFSLSLASLAAFVVYVVGCYVLRVEGVLVLSCKLSRIAQRRAATGGVRGRFFTIMHLLIPKFPRGTN